MQREICCCCIPNQINNEQLDGLIMEMSRLAPITLLIPLCAMLVLFTLSPILAETAQAEPNGQGIAAAETSPNRLVYVVPVHDTIDHGLRKFLERAFREAEEVGAHYVILDIDTFGGYVDAAMKIGPMIQRLSVPTAAFIHGHAFSAGTISRSARMRSSCRTVR